MSIDKSVQHPCVTDGPDPIHLQSEHSMPIRLQEHSVLHPLAMYLMSLNKEERGGKAFALYPLRHTNVPWHVRFDEDALKYCIGGKTAGCGLRVLNLRAAGVYRRKRFDHAFTADGVCARVQMRSPPPAQAAATTLPARGIWAIDELKCASRLSDMHVVGVDPGKREHVVGVDVDPGKREHVVGVDVDNVRKSPVR